MCPKKVLLISMPFGALERQALGISILKAILMDSGIQCDLRYLTFTFAELIGADDYYWLSNDVPHTAFAGEWIFTSALYGSNQLADKNYIKEVLQDEWLLNATTIKRILNMRNMVPHFMDYCMETIPWKEYGIVGFTSTFEQNIPSLALAKKLKKSFPELTIVFGGGNWEGEMGRELHRLFTFVDYVCEGEADKSFRALVELIHSKRSMKKSIGKTKGIIYRSNGASIYTGQADIIRDMDQLPFPDYSDYFSGLDKTSTADAILPNLLIETSRGCWWGQKCHCIFCGLNGDTLHFRSKSPQRAINEIDYLVGQWKFDMVQAVDNVIDMSYLKSVFPNLAGRNLTFFYEVRTNLSRENVKILSEAGVNDVQPGIESLSNHVLKLMRKGTTALKNIQVLKWFKEHGISAGWNFLYGFPGETREDYNSIIDTLHSIRFLEPPKGCGTIRLDRFSPYFNNPEEFGLTNVRPTRSYKYLYPFPDENLRNIAYYFEYDYQPGTDPTGYANEAIELVKDWQGNPEKGTLQSISLDDNRLFLRDTRSCATRSYFVLSGINSQVYDYCDSSRSCRAVLKHLNSISNRSFHLNQVRNYLDALVANRLMVTDGKSYLSLAIRSGSRSN